MTNQQIMIECFTKVAAHYADKIAESGITPTEADVKAAVAANWEQISREVEELYNTVTA